MTNKEKQEENNNYPKDKESFYRYFMITLSLIITTLVGMAYDELKQHNKLLNAVILSGVEDKKDISFIKEKILDQKEIDKQQNERLATHDKLLFTKPDDIKIKSN